MTFQQDKWFPNILTIEGDLDSQEVFQSTRLAWESIYSLKSDVEGIISKVGEIIGLEEFPEPTQKSKRLFGGLTVRGGFQRPRAFGNPHFTGNENEFPVGGVLNATRNRLPYLGNSLQLDAFQAPEYDPSTQALTIVGGITGRSTLSITGAATLSSTLAVTGTSTLTGDVTTGGDLTVGDQLIVSGVGPHAIGTAIIDIVAMLVGGAFTSTGSGTQVVGFDVNHTPLTGVAGDTTSLVGSLFTTNITTQAASESIADIAQIQIDEPFITDNLTGGGVITNASTLLITGAPTEGVANFALRIASGLSLVQTLEIDGDLNHDGSNVGFFGIAPVARAGAYTQTFSTADKTHANSTFGAISETAVTQTTPWGFATQAQGDAVSVELNDLGDDVADLKQLVNAIIDDLQAYGLLQ